MAVLKTARALGVLVLLWLPVQAIPAPTEYQVKAVFLFNFARFVDWPAVAFVSESAPFNICVYGADPFGPGLDSVVQGESVAGRPFAVRRLRDTSGLRDCQILYIAPDAAGDMRGILASLGQQSTLTVSDVDAGSQAVMVRLMTVGGKIRLRVNVDAARAAHLTISSNLLRSAEIVGGAGSGAVP